MEGAEQSHAVPDPYTLHSQELNDDYLVIKTKIVIKRPIHNSHFTNKFIQTFSHNGLFITIFVLITK